jgi:hypothetical protein
MSEGKEEKTTKKVETDKEKIEKARKKRLALAKQSVPAQEQTDSREEFRKYFLKLKKSLNLEKYLEEVIWAHLKAIKHDKKELFDKGIQHFGYKI